MLANVEEKYKYKKHNSLPPLLGKVRNANILETDNKNRKQLKDLQCNDECIEKLASDSCKYELVQDFQTYGTQTHEDKMFLRMLFYDNGGLQIKCYLRFQLQ